MINGNYILVTAPKDYPGKKYRNKYCYQHTLVYWQHYGIVPNDEQIIHHKNGNKKDNRIENLELLSKKDHNVIHNSIGERIVFLQCPNCDKSFCRKRSNTHFVKKQKNTFCSRQCIGYFYSNVNKIN